MIRDTRYNTSRPGEVYYLAGTVRLKSANLAVFPRCETLLVWWRLVEPKSLLTAHNHLATCDRPNRDRQVADHRGAALATPQPLRIGSHSASAVTLKSFESTRDPRVRWGHTTSQPARSLTARDERQRPSHSAPFLATAAAPGHWLRYPLFLVVEISVQCQDGAKPQCVFRVVRCGAKGATPRPTDVDCGVVPQPNTKGELIFRLSWMDACPG